jgi:hypothetical protein
VLAVCRLDVRCKFAAVAAIWKDMRCVITRFDGACPLFDSSENLFFKFQCTATCDLEAGYIDEMHCKARRIRVRDWEESSFRLLGMVKG